MGNSLLICFIYYGIWEH